MWLYDALTIACWIIFIVYWTVASTHVKHDRHVKSAWQSSGFAISMALVFLVVVATLAERDILWELFSIYPVVPNSPIIDAIGTVVCATGIAVAIWARVHLGRNWSAEPAIKEGHILVTSGPYRFVRHPIYASLLLAACGSALVGGSIWIVVLITLAGILMYRMIKEERILFAEFKQEYFAYKRRTCLLIPFIL